jgi:hypothetical protein
MSQADEISNVMSGVPPDAEWSGASSLWSIGELAIVQPYVLVQLRRSILNGEPLFSIVAIGADKHRYLIATESRDEAMSEFSRILALSSTSGN